MSLTRFPMKLFVENQFEVESQTRRLLSSTFGRGETKNFLKFLVN